MEDVTIRVSRPAVMEEVAQTTGYAGAKMSGDDDAYERIAIVDEDEAELQRFWDESRAEVSRALMRLLASEGMAEDGDTYELVLRVSEDFDKALLPGMERGLFSFFVHGIVAKWFVYANKQEAGGYAEIGKALLDDVRRKAFYKKAPRRFEN